MSTNDDVMQFLDSLGQNDDLSLSQSLSHSHSRERTTSSSSGSSSYLHVTSSATGDGANTPDEQSVLDFLDEITQSAAVPTPMAMSLPRGTGTGKTPSPGASGAGHGATRGTSTPSKYLQQKQQQQLLQQQKQQQQEAQQGGASWLGSLWSTASEAVKTTQTAVQSSVKATRESQASRNLQERVKGIVNAENIGKIGTLWLHIIRGRLPFGFVCTDDDDQLNTNLSIYLSLSLSLSLSTFTLFSDLASS
ncbi:MAG: hypothetical protein BYD32DRAFT_298718 [Podila humilis]|nr:MAG: hypothetical protein BYD32DRAFT_298718 [Podila humilis]